jgi:TIR domain
MDKKNIFISHASEDKERVVEPFIQCLEQDGITNIWYDKDQIEGGDVVVQRINEGLSTSKMAIIIFSISYMGKHWTEWELWVLSALLITHKIRIIPFIYRDITYEQIIEKYPILIPLRFEPIPPCEEIIRIVRGRLNDSRNLIDNPTFNFVATEPMMETSDNEQPTEPQPESIERIDAKKLSNDYNDLKESKSKEVKEMALTEIRNYSNVKGFWKSEVSWKIMKLLIFSQDDNDIMNGIYILEEMLKKSIQVLGKNNQVVRNANELFGHKLLDTIKPESSKRLSNDSLCVLDIIVDYDILFNVCLLGLIDAIKNISNDNEYSDYIQKFVFRLEKGDREQIGILCGKMRNLAKESDDVTIRKRALVIFKHFHEKSL